MGQITLLVDSSPAGGCMLSAGKSDSKSDKLMSFLITSWTSTEEQIT
jgi:hypothetical protein